MYIGLGHCGSISGAEGKGIRQHADQPGRRDSGRRAAGGYERTPDGSFLVGAISQKVFRILI